MHFVNLLWHCVNNILMDLCIIVAQFFKAWIVGSSFVIPCMYWVYTPALWLCQNIHCCKTCDDIWHSHLFKKVYIQQFVINCEISWGMGLSLTQLKSCQGPSLSCMFLSTVEYIIALHHYLTTKLGHWGGYGHYQASLSERTAEDIFINQMNRWSGKYVILVTVGGTNFKAEDLYLIENTAIDKKGQVWHDVLALIVFASVI